MGKKFVVVIVLVAVFVAFATLDLNQHMTLQSLQSSQARFDQAFAQNPWLIGLGFFGFYVLVTALSLPGAAILTLAAGMLFGVVLGTLLVSFASTIGATIAFLLSRYVLHDWVQHRFGRRLKAINRGIEKDGVFYLFALRLLPVFPFFVINLAMGLTPLRTWTFYWVSQVGMLAGTVVYVNAGTQLAEINKPADILSLELLASFTLLALFPWLIKGIFGLLRRRRVYRAWTRPKSYDRNLIVIGAGAAGLVSAYIAATVKAKVTLIEANKMGGDCLNYGCVPSKALIRSAKQAHDLRHGDRFGVDAGAAKINFKAVMQRVRHVIEQIEPHDSVERYTQLGVEVLQGYGRMINPWTVEVTLSDGGSEILTSRAIIIAAGAEPVVPALPGLQQTGYLTNESLWQALAEREAPPKRMVVLGGGPIGCELGQAFARLGSQVIQVERGERLMAREDKEVSELVRVSLEADGVQVLTQHSAVRCERDGECKYLLVEHDGVEQRLQFDELICAIGRKARLSGYGLEDLGIKCERTVSTNEYLETLYPNIFAAGDVAGPYQFTHTAAHMAWYAAVNALFGQFKRFKVDYRVIPWTTFVDPEVARVGLNEQEAREQGVDFEVTRFNLEELDRAITDSATQGFIKVLTPPGKDRILGVTIVGAHAGELLAEYVLAMRHGLGLNKILGTIHTYPTLAEANKFAAGEWKKAHAPQRLLELLGHYHRWRRGSG